MPAQADGSGADAYPLDLDGIVLPVGRRQRRPSGRSGALGDQAGSPKLWNVRLWCVSKPVGAVSLTYA
jgi:hypothetical protein